MRLLRGITGALGARPGLVGGLLVTAAIGVGGAAGLGIGTWRSVCRDCPSIAQIYSWQPTQSTKLLDDRGRLIAELFQERRTPVSISELPKHVPEAIIAVEDKRFYQHHGFSPRGFFRAALVKVPGMGWLLGRRGGGGSTITQQLARNIFQREIGFQRSGFGGYARKLKELHVAIELEQVYTKDQILEGYINQINFGHGWYGIETAAERYFGKPASQLNPAEAAMLAALGNAPARYDPYTHADRALARRNMVLGLMVDQGYLPEAQVTQWKAWPLPTRSFGGDEGAVAPYFVEWVRDYLDERFGGDVYRRGFKVYTTLDLDMQNAAQAAMDSGWARIERWKGYDHPRYHDVIASGGSPKDNETPYLQGMFVALDPLTGAVRAMIGGRDFRDSKFNRTTQALRQPGSSFKPILYTAALSSGIPASHVIYDAPLELDLDNGQTYSPGNSDGIFHGPVTLREALKKSINVVAVKLGQEVGMQTVVQYARRMGLTTPLPPYPSVAIGSAEVIPLQLAGAYTALATPGYLASPYSIARVEDADGSVLWQAQPQRKQVLDSLDVFIVRDMMKGVLNNGTGYPARDPARGNLPYTIPGAGKTGTTNDYGDAWFVGFTPNLLAAVWFGFDTPKTIMHGAEGGALAAPVWDRFMREVYVSQEPPVLPVPADWSVPAGLTTREVDSETGRLASELCPKERAYTEFFVPGTEPTQACDGGAGGLFNGGGIQTPGADSLRADSGRPAPPPRPNPNAKF